MVIYESRKKELAQVLGNSQGCVTDNSAMMASVQDLSGEFRIYTDDMKFLLDNVGFCTAEANVKQGVIIHTDGLKADVIINEEIVGNTEETIDLDVGAYNAIITKNGYVDQTLAFTVKSGEYSERYITLVEEGKETQETPTTPTSGPNLLAYGQDFVPTIVLGADNWFGWGVRNYGDVKWRGKVGVKIVDANDVEFKYEGDAAYQQTVEPGEATVLWMKTTVPATLVKTSAGGFKEISKLLTRTN